jgi:hypothetical protein
MKTYCAAAFRQVYSDNAGRYRLCCHAADHPDLKQFNTRNTSPFKYFLSEEMENIREQMLSGDRVSGCEICYNMEDRGFQSWRQWKYNSIYPLSANVEKVALKLRIMGSYCNLGCYMCYPYNSSTRRQELKEKSISWKDYDGETVNISTKKYDEIIKDVLAHIHLVDYINITGGEPLQLPRMWQFLEQIPDEYAKQMTISFDTNLSELEFKQWSIWQLVSRFKHIKLGVSCDHYGDKLSWIRYPLDVRKFEANLQTAKELISNLNVTVSILNIDDLHSIKSYYDEFNTTFYGINSNPTMLSVRNLPNTLKDQYIEKYSSYEMVVQELSKHIIPLDLAKGLDYCQRLNSNRTVDFNTVFKPFLEKLNEQQSNL